MIEPFITQAINESGPDLPIKLSSGPFAGLQLPHMSPNANAGYITRTLIETYLITHPHLDHISGFVVNTASLPGSRPKRVAGLPSTIEALKQHIFNNVIWPNLSDENNGAGLITYMRLVEGGSPYIGNDDDRGYVEVCDGLSVKTWSVSHGHCMERHEHQGSTTDFHSHTSLDMSAHLESFSNAPRRSPSLSGQMSSKPGYSQERYSGEHICVYDSSAYFIRDVTTGREVLIFGDVEPDVLSLSPRNIQIWTDAAPKIAAGSLKGILIECSYDDSQDDNILFGHLAPRHLIAELEVLGQCVTDARAAIKDREKAAERGDDSGRKRKRYGSPYDYEDSHSGIRRRSTRTSSGLRAVSFATARPELSRANSASVSPRARPQPSNGIQVEQFDDNFALGSPALRLRSPLISEAVDGRVNQSMKPLEGLKVYLIHIKEKLTDGPSVGERILKELNEYEEDAKLGCEFVISGVGMSILL